MKFLIPLVIQFLIINLSYGLDCKLIKSNLDSLPLENIQYSFTGCEIFQEKHERDSCSFAHFNNFIKSNMIDSSNIDVYGEVSIKFAIQNDGTMQNIEIVKSPSEKLSSEIFSILQFAPKWNPTYKNGKTIKTTTDYRIPFYPDTFPVVKGCEHITDLEERYECHRKKLKSARINLFYEIPKRKRNKYFGYSIVRYTIDQEGKITNPKIIKDPGNGAGEEALKMVKAYPRYYPAIKKGKPVPYMRQTYIAFNRDHIYPSKIEWFGKTFKAKSYERYNEYWETTRYESKVYMAKTDFVEKLMLSENLFPIRISTNDKEFIFREYALTVSDHNDRFILSKDQLNSWNQEKFISLLKSGSIIKFYKTDNNHLFLTLELL